MNQGQINRGYVTAVNDDPWNRGEILQNKSVRPKTVSIYRIAAAALDLEMLIELINIFSRLTPATNTDSGNAAGKEDNLTYKTNQKLIQR